MRFIAIATFLLMLLKPSEVFSQSVFAPFDANYYHLIDRFEIKSGQLSSNFHSNVKPFFRKNIVELTEKVEEKKDLSSIDEFNLQYLQNDSWEWLKIKNLAQGDAKKPFLKYFLKKKSDFYYYQNKDVDFHVSPIFHFGFGTDNIAKDKPFINTRGVEMRGVISKKLGFYSEFTENQVIYPEYTRRFIRQSQGFPYEGFTKISDDDSTKMLSDFLSARGYITFQALKNIQVQFGHDKNFVGSGIRSLILSDFSAPYLQLKINTTIGRVQYVNIFAQLRNRQLATPGDSLLPSKYMAFHHLNVNIGKNLNIGLFETVMFGKRKEGFDLNYLNPIIFLRSVEGNLGSLDNSILGFDFKYNFLKHISIYGQIVIDEWLSKHIFAQDGYIGNKYALQIGGKYIDVFGIPNLDFQTEYNIARPYTYSHFSTYSSFVNYNLPMAHPLGANFKELLAVIRYQPLPNLFLNFNYSFAQKGEDYGLQPWGGDILKLNQYFQPLEYGNEIGQGRATTTYFFDFGASYMIKHNFFVDLHYQSRIYQRQYVNTDFINSNFSFGIRWNAPQRQLMF
jgi:Capsule assembly protein Wzi